MTDRQVFWKTFLIGLAVQLGIYAFYWLTVSNSAGGESPFQNVVLTVYRPILLIIYEVQVAMDIHSWAGLGFMQLYVPLIGVFVYSFVVAFIVLLYRKAVSHHEKSSA